MNLIKPFATFRAYFDVFLEKLASFLKRFSKFVSVLKYGLLLVIILFSVLVSIMRYWLLPNADNYRADVENALSKSIGLRVKIGSVTGDWSGVNPRLTVRDISVFDSLGRPALFLGRVENIIAWSSILHADLRLRLLEIDEPILNIRRDPQGTIYIAGMALVSGTSDNRLTDWILRQDRIVIRDAFISWHDEKSKVKPLTLSKVQFRLENSGTRHRFGLQAIPPSELASPLDLRGDMVGESLSEWEKWYGTLYAQFNYTDIAAWRTWVSFPIAIRQGTGGLKLWVTFDQARPIRVTADVQLRDVKTRLGQNLPELDLKVLSGRVALKKTPSNFEFSTWNLGFVTEEGQILQPTNFYFRFLEGNKNRLARGEIRANRIDLEPLKALAAHLPIKEEWRVQLNQYSPKGQILDLAFRWRGELNNPHNYSIKSAFRNLGVATVGRFPGLSGISGNVDADQKGGVISLNSTATKIAFTKVFRESLNFDRFTGQVKWAVNAHNLNLRLSNITFANSHFAGNAFGEYRTLKNSPGWIDLTANLIRADARQVARYMPLSAGQQTHDWLAKSLVAGQSNDVRLRLRGDLIDFPFDKKKDSIFQVNAKVTDGALRYANDWPRIDNIQADLVFRGNRMEIYSQQANIYGANLSKVQVVIPDLSLHDKTLEIDGEAQGATQEFVKFINTSPVSKMIDGAAANIKSQGMGKLLLKIGIPLHQVDGTKINGQYEFDNNQIILDGNMPPVEQVSGVFQFTESTFKAKDIRAHIFGGATTINAKSNSDHNVQVDIVGKADLVNLRKTYSHPIVGYLSGSPEWHALINIRKKQVELLIESDLLGLTSELPAPFTKAANESVPFRFEKKITGDQRDVLSLNYGKLISAQLLRRHDAGTSVIERGVVNVGNVTPSAPVRSGLWVKAMLSYLNIDQWSSIINPSGASSSGGRGGFDIKVDNLEFFGKRFNDLRVNGTSQTTGMQFNVAAKEVNGDVQWRSQGKGQIIARLKNLSLPDTVTQLANADNTSTQPKTQEKEWPAIDVVIDHFQIKDRLLGRVEVVAAPDGRDWRFDKIKLVTPESTLQVDGVWSNWLTQPQTKVNVVLDVKDIGQALTRYGYADSVKRGYGRIEGQLSWSGNPLRFDYPSLNGKLAVGANKGQFSKIEPGIGKLLGVLSLQSLPRRITLDFRDVFSQGFAFDEIGGNVRILRGVMYTDSLLIDGPAARVVMGGEVSLVEETQKLRVKVSPKLSDGVALASAFLANPVIGVVTFFVQKILKDPLDKLIFYEYDVTGTWSEPQVTKVPIPSQVPSDNQKN